MEKSKTNRIPSSSREYKSPDPARSPKIVVVGSGAIGSLYAGKLFQAGAHITMVCRSDYTAIKKHGITVDSPWGNFHYRPQRIITTPLRYQETPDFVLVALKVLPKIDLASLLRPLVKTGTAIVLLQNGIDIEAPVVDAFPDNELISGLAFVCVNRAAPGMINHLDYGKLTLGAYPRGITAGVSKLSHLFNQAGVPCKIAPEIRYDRWIKVMWNAAFNSLSVLTGGKDTKTMVENKHLINLIKRIMEEVRRAALTTGCRLPAALIAQHIKATKTMKPYKTSMLLDYQNGKEMEVEAIVGNIIRIGKQKKLRLPYLTTAYTLLTSLNPSSE